MTKASARKGAAAEARVRNWLRAHGWPLAEVRKKEGPNDRGDISGCPNLVIEVKDCRNLRLYDWIDEMLVERLRDGARYGYLIVKRSGTTDVGNWYGMVPVATMNDMILELEHLRNEVERWRSTVES